MIKYEKMRGKCRELWGIFFLVLTLKSCAIKANSVHRRLGLEIMYRTFLSLHLQLGPMASQSQDSALNITTELKYETEATYAG